jgi:aryl-alcohol dehydrogenase-like predicted oxidoreductase
LEEQLTLSLDRLGLATLDVCLLHNPEYFLLDAKNRNPSINAIQLEDLRQEFYRRLEQAFIYFEAQVTSGRMQYYGVSSNTCTAKPDNPDTTSLSRMLEAAQSAAQQSGQAQHHFRVLQLPMNLFEAGALLTHNTGKEQSQTVLSFAREKEIAVLVNRPLNAIPEKGESMMRLANPQAEISNTNFQAQQPKVAALEHDYKQVLGPNIPHPNKGASPLDYFNWAEELTRVRASVQNLEHWDQIESQTISPHVNRVFQILTQHFNGKKEEEKIWESWRDKYVPELVALLKVMRMEAAQKSAKKLSEIAKILDPLLPEDRHHESFSRKSLWTVASTPGVTSVLNGMRHPLYVDDSLTILQWEPLQQPRPIFEALKTSSTP